MISGALEFMNEWDANPQFETKSRNSATHATSVQSSSNLYGDDDEEDWSGYSSGDHDDSSNNNSKVIDFGGYVDEKTRRRERLMNAKDEQEKRAVNVSRTLVILALCTVAFILGHLVYFYIKYSERDEFISMVSQSLCHY